MRRLLILAAVAGCATTQAPVTTQGVGEEPSVVTGTVSAPSPVSTLAPRKVPRKASRSRATADPVGTGSHLNWRALRECESSNNYSDRDSATYRGAYQFDRQTWRTVGGTGDPADASAAEQDMRALRLYQERGRQPWPVCGRHL